MVTPHQVRLLVGVLKAVGIGEVHPDEMPRLLEARTPTALPAMAPGTGLFLASVQYKDVELEHKEDDTTKDSKAE